MARPEPAVDSWGAFRRRYTSYRKRPTWNHWRRPPNIQGVVSARDAALMRERGTRAAARLNRAIHRLGLDGRFPKRSSQFRQRDMNWVVRERVLSAPALRTLWHALILDRDRYTCQYCQRSAKDVWRESGHRRSLGLVVDHQRPRSQEGRSYDFKNSMAACWTCNGIKASLPAEAFREELQSLARAILGGAAG